MIKVLPFYLLLPVHLDATHHHRQTSTLMSTTNQQQHPQVMIEGAFSHAPFDGHSYGFRTKSARYVIPDRDGLNEGQTTWVEIATCCAATPISGTSPRDDAHPEAFAPPLADRCLSYSEQERGMTYKSDVEPKGIKKSKCAAQNVGFYHDLTRDDYHSRHSACCSWFKMFLKDAWSEYPDTASKEMIDRVNDGSTSIYEKSRNMLVEFDAWKANQCRPNGVPNLACCSACLSDNIPNKLAKYVSTSSFADPTTGATPDGPSNNLCSYFGDGWCGVNDFPSSNPSGGGQQQVLAGISLQENPSIFVDGAFRHRPTRSDLLHGEPGHEYTMETSLTTTSENKLGPETLSTHQEVEHTRSTVKVPISPDAVPYVTGYGGPELTVPEHDGAVTGQMTWVDMAKCCALTPLDDVQFHGGLSYPPSERCMTSIELESMSSGYSKKRGPCKQENMGWYRDVAHLVGEPLWKPRYGKCCDYMKHFLVNAEKEFSDPSSLSLLKKIKTTSSETTGVGPVLAAAAAASVQQLSSSLVLEFEHWNKHVCTDVQGSSTGRCCYDCLRPSINKLNRYSGFDSMVTCGHDGEGWCGRDQKVPRSLLKQITRADPAAEALRQTTQEVEIAKKSNSTKGEDIKNKKKKFHVTVDTMKMNIKKKETLTMRLKELAAKSSELEKRAEKILVGAHAKRKRLSARTVDVVDRAKLTLLGERVGVMKMLKESKGNDESEKFQMRMKWREEKMERYQRANEDMPLLLSNVEEFVASGRANALLEEEEN
jgi:hypothetical protein